MTPDQKDPDFGFPRPIFLGKVVTASFPCLRASRMTDRGILSRASGRNFAQSLPSGAARYGIFHLECAACCKDSGYFLAPFLDIQLNNCVCEI